MNIRFYRNPETGLPHIYEHGVDEDEVEDVLLNPGEDWAGSRKSRNALIGTPEPRTLERYGNNTIINLHQTFYSPHDSHPSR